VTASTAPTESVEAEQGVLGALLLDAPVAYAGIKRSGLTAQHFSEDGHALIFATAMAMAERGDTPDAISVFAELQAKGVAHRVGGLQYLNQLSQSVPSASNAELYATTVGRVARRRRVEGAAIALQRAAASPGLSPEAFDDALSGLVADLASCAQPQAHATFAAVSIADLASAEPAPQQWWLEAYVPAGHVTLFTGHGGVGKSMLSLMMACAFADGRPFIGKATRRGRVLFFSAEDPAELLRRRLRRVCSDWGIEPATLAQSLRVVDATEMDAALYVEHRTGGVRHGATTRVYEALRQFIERESIDVVVLDNASDLFDGDEIVRQLVRGFVRSLAHLVRARGGAVVLLAHVDKITSRAGKAAGGESYSGSTAWHNSVRSRMALLETAPGLLELQHQKCNLGPKQAPLQLSWPQGGLPRLADHSSPQEMQHKPCAADSMRDLVALIRDYYGRGEWVSTSLQSRSNAARLFVAEARYPRHLKPEQVAQLLREAQRARFIEAEAYRGADRKPRDRWRVTPSGVALADNLPLFGMSAEGSR